MNSNLRISISLPAADILLKLMDFRMRKAVIEETARIFIAINS